MEKKILTTVQDLIIALNSNDISYCHWKSNVALSKSLLGQTDIDLLIQRKDANAFKKILNQLGFRTAIAKEKESFPSIEHYFAFDIESGILVHVHAYYRVITGESLVKNYRFPIEEMLLANTHKINSLQVVNKHAELIVFTLRIMLKHTSIVELLLLSREYGQLKHEIHWLQENEPLDRSLELLNYWLPTVDSLLFTKCVAALNSSTPVYKRIILGYRLRSQLKTYTRYSTIQAWFVGIKKFTTMAYRRLTHSKKGLASQSGGILIAFVGPEATGKSTLISKTSQWLGEHYLVKRIHAGKPKSTAISFFPNLFVPALRFFLPQKRSGNIETQYISNTQTETKQKIYPLIFAIRSVLLAFDRRVLLTRAFREAANGTIVLCDRYPSSSSGLPDSPQLLHIPVSQNQYPLRYLLAIIENRLYREIPSPDLVISLNVPVEIAVARNETRGKKEPEEYVRYRHAQSSKMDFGETPIYIVNTNQPIETTVSDIKNTIWNIL